MKYYIQRHASGCVGNCFLWWRKGGNGYTCDLDDAEVFDGEDARFQNVAKDKRKYTAWEQNYIDSCAHRHVDHQYVSDDAKGLRTSDAPAEARAAGSSAPACSVCGSRQDVEYYSVGNVGITQVLPLCQNCKPNAPNEAREDKR